MSGLKKIFPLLISALICISVYSEERIIMGTIDSVRNDGYVTITCDNPLTEAEYRVLNGDEVLIGWIYAPEKLQGSKSGLRYIARFRKDEKVSGSLLRGGVRIILRPAEKEIDRNFIANKYNEKNVYRERIITPVDGREMALVPEGRFFMGSDHGDRDESPEHEEYLPDFYIDVYEVSNSDYKAYADSEGLKYPDYWKEAYDRSGAFTDTWFSRLPVIVTYHEAKKYAAWAGKRLPDEKEWEKAARYPSSLDKAGQFTVYTWGYEFREGISNTEEFWADEKTGENLKVTIKQRYGISILQKGYLPVDIYEPVAVSFYGCVNLDGNAQEWTESWYANYEGNSVKDKKYGKQFKVIRGGAYFTTGREARVTDRKIGGVPDLYTDRIAGFRCVRNATDRDKK